MLKRHLSSMVLSYVASIFCIYSVPTMPVHGQSKLPEFTLSGQANALRLAKDQLGVKSWVRPVHSSLAGKSPAEFTLQSQAGATIPLWSGSAVNGTYHFQMVGKDPTIKTANPLTWISSPIIPVKVTFQPSNVVFNPTAPNSCTPRPVINMVENSPLFVPVSGTLDGTPIGTGQFVSLFQRANFFKYTGPTGVNPQYQTSLLPFVPVELNITVVSDNIFPAADWAGCNPLGLIDINSWDQLLQSTVIPQLGRFGVGPRTLPIFVFENIAMFDSSNGACCILGYHNAYTSPTSGAMQTYAVAMYDTTGGAFGNNQDTMVLSHEIAEWMDDPTTTNPTPSWGGTGQDANSCQSNLEVGDPLTGTIFPIAMPHFTYHVQDLAFKSWFYHEAPSIGVNGWYSLFGTFQSFAAPCP
jgi:hypothetical protein